MKGIVDNLNKLSQASMWVAVIAAGLLTPVILLFVTTYTGGSVFLEELGKALVIGLFILYTPTSARVKLTAATVFGLLFGVSEAVLYAGNFVQVGNATPFFGRLLWTAPMHGLSALSIAAVPVFTHRRWLLALGFVAALLIHLGFNIYLAPLLSAL
jgi:hypothetical protein